MKKIILLVFAMLLVLGGAQAQKKKTNKPVNNKETVDGIVKGDIQITEYLPLPAPEVGLDAPLQEVLKNRQTIRNFSEEDLPLEMLSSLLWCTYGYNRPEEQKRVVPSAVNCQEYDIYVFTREGTYLYDAEKNALGLVVLGDNRSIISQQKFFAIAPVSIVMVANYDRMGMFKDEATRDFYAATDCGYISQDIYLFCSAAHLGTVACGGIDREAIQKLLGFKNGRAMLAHPVGLK